MTFLFNQSYIHNHQHILISIHMNVSSNILCLINTGFSRKYATATTSKRQDNHYDKVYKYSSAVIDTELASIKIRNMVSSPLTTKPGISVKSQLKSSNNCIPRQCHTAYIR